MGKKKEATKGREVVKVTGVNLKNLGPALETRNATEVKAILEGPDIEAIRAEMLGNTPKTEGMAEAHTAYQAKMDEMGKIVEELFARKDELKKPLDGMKGFSPAKSQIFDEIKRINENIQTLYRTMPNLKEHVEYEFRIKQAERVEHFGDLNSLLQGLVKEGRAEVYPGMSFWEAREKFPKTTTIMYGRAAYVVKAYRLGKALIDARDRSIAEAENRKAEPVATAGA